MSLKDLVIDYSLYRRVLNKMEQPYKEEYSRIMESFKRKALMVAKVDALTPLFFDSSTDMSRVAVPVQCSKAAIEQYVFKEIVSGWTVPYKNKRSTQRVRVRIDGQKSILSYPISWWEVRGAIGNESYSSMGFGTNVRIRTLLQKIYRGSKPTTQSIKGLDKRSK